MEKKVFTIFIFGIIITIAVYLVYYKEENSYLAITDNFSLNSNIINYNELTFNELNKKGIYYENFGLSNLTSRNIVDLIVNNNEINSKSIKQIIKEVNIIVISIGINELHDNQSINLYLYYMDIILREVTSLNKNVILIGLYSEYEKIEEVNFRLENLASKYDIKYLDLEFLSINDVNAEKLLLNKSGNELVHEKIIDIYNNNFKK